MGRVIVLGSSNVDLVVRSDRLPAPGETVLGHEFLRTPGGKGANQAVAAARAGASVAFVGAVGDDELGRFAVYHLEADGIDLSHLRRVAGVGSGVALIVVDRDGHNQIAVYPGANGCVSAADVAALPAGLFTPPGVYVTQLETPPAAVWAGLARARDAGLRTVFNPTPPDPTFGAPRWLSLVDVLVVNEPEAAWLTGRAVGAEAAVAELRSRGAADIIVTLGERGYLLAAAGGPTVWHPAVPVQAMDTTGAGDTFVGVLAAGLGEGRTVAEAAARANRAAALAVTRPGAQAAIPRRSEVDGWERG
jgi:ribokinase